METFGGLDVYGYHTQTKRMGWGIRYHTRFPNIYSHDMTNVVLKILLNGCLLCHETDHCAIGRFVIWETNARWMVMDDTQQNS